ncbi:type IV pili twitching motility protein PilT [Candidatus Kaiserbacteria bacterium RIFCSPHIGHO2_01_FULL_50_13]|uniref:Type IV pili twitching motility protein PilT n=1 Tax=Candidatus Kaiserbacteria bacterium RIFCSPLOWO2_01_FULL_50_24 TaxID=1798507 RepID=A0A1F6EQX9_9BACT|nr:MAG: type IV pili twitching motility protein PilT [Candidatus Kaiserbacteria bacterium RIFCSPHIGHO2_01_FULL_50_13]OGG76036.1 MAG: type IV pili twitching motility protein PilT [Candidatus Kaiserbacteria bacterium RIFCSPLOWO2_01_FULL_50_24]OGG82042.1 MAG: type IV pili twitching motility protein PilT [Candidatus Kaiserbacteria bacterium RIFCSPLOWO2_02_FULL_51_13]
MEYLPQLKKYINVVVHEDASDLHLSVGAHPTVRVSGTLAPMLKEPPLSEEDVAGLIKTLLTDEQYQRLWKEMELDFAYETDDKYRFRGNAFFHRGVLGVALRLIPKTIRTLAELNLPDVLATFARKSQGFFLVVGPVGHGKTTTLASLVEIINTERMEHIVTIEDPIEYLYEPKQSLINQREVGSDTGGFAGALYAAFRQDVDVILVGEMRDPETMSAAVSAAETGHLVFSTLHTNDAAQTIDRIIDSFPATQQDQIRLQLSGSLAGIFSQRLVPRITGGRIPAYELLINNKAVANLIRERRTHEINTVIETSSTEGMINMDHSLAELVSRGEITVESAYQHSLNPSMLQKLL